MMSCCLDMLSQRLMFYRIWTKGREEMGKKVYRERSASNKVQLYYSQLHPNTKEISGRNLGTSDHIKSKRGNTLFPRSRGCMVYKGYLSRQTNVLSVRKLVNIADADESGLSGKESLGGL